MQTKRDLTPTADVLVGRQPIFDRDRKVIAYELLFRDASSQATIIDGEQATSEVMVSAFLEIGLQQLVGKHPAFLNVTRSFLLDNATLPFPPDRLVLEILETVQPDAQLVRTCQAMAARGVRFALDDFVYHPAFDPLLKLAEFVKIDVLAQSRSTVAEQFQRVRPLSNKLLAEKVETQEDFEYFRNLGFDCFQGYFFAQPNIVKGRRLAPNRMALLTLVAKLQDSECEIGELEQLVRSDVAISYKLLRLINSPFFGAARKIDSICQALVRLGMTQLRNWLSVIALATVSDKPNALLLLAVQRARMCEELARACRCDNPAGFFTVGLLSVLDALLDRPLEELLAAMSLSDALVDALVRRQGVMGDALSCVTAYEAGRWEAAEFAGLEPTAIRGAYLASLEWSEALCAQLGST